VLWDAAVFYITLIVAAYAFEWIIQKFSEITGNEDE